MGAAVVKLARADSKPGLRTVDSIDLQRYAGTWYEIARYPNRFQRKCVSDTKAEYTLRQDGKIQVVNSCRQRDGSLKSARGKAKVVDRKTSSRLKVTFFWPFSGDYWIIGLDPEYRYAIVGEPNRKYLWILSRTPAMTDALYQEAVQTIESAGYDASRLVSTPQSGTSRPAA